MSARNQVRQSASSAGCLFFADHDMLAGALQDWPLTPLAICRFAAGVEGRLPPGLQGIHWLPRPLAAWAAGRTSWRSAVFSILQGIKTGPEAGSLRGSVQVFR